MREGTLKRTLGLAEVIFFGVGSILGAGIYAIIGKVAGFSGNMIWLSFLIASVAALMTAFSYAELSSMFPKTGAEYIYVKEALSKKFAVAIGLIISLNGIISGATVSIGFAGYFSALLDVSLLLASLGIIAFVWLVNVTGIRQSSVVNIIFTLIEFSGLVIVIIVGLPQIGKADLLEIPEGGMNHIFLAAALSYFAYIGFEEIVKLSEETKDPKKRIPQALFASNAIVMVVYLLVAICAINVISAEELGNSKYPLADVVATKLGRFGITLISVIALFATTNTILSNMIGSSRILHGLGKDNKYLARLSYVSPKRRTPMTALILCAFIMGAFALIGKLEVVALIANLFIFITFLFVNLSVVVLRFRQKNTPRVFRIPLNIGSIPLPAVLGILLTLTLLGYSIYGLAIAAV